jgi:glucose/arabinose dehydrogenase
MPVNVGWLAISLGMLLLISERPAEAVGLSLRFFGHGRDGVDRVLIPIDDPATATPGPPADVGATDFTLEFWMKARSVENPAPVVACGANLNWRRGHVVIDRDRADQDRKFGVSIAGGRVVFGVSGDATGHHTLCGTSDVLDDEWHHVAVERRRLDGWLWLYVDGVLEADADGPDGDVSYPDDGVPDSSCGGPCLASDPFLVIGAEKHDAGVEFPSYSGWIDEIRISRRLRYTGSTFTRPGMPFGPDADTVALYHLDEGAGDLVVDSSGAPGGPSHGIRVAGGAPAGPAWSSDTAPFVAPAVAFEPLATGLVNPVAVTHASDGSARRFIALQEGRILVHDGAGVLGEPFLDVRSLVSCCAGERGLASLVFDPGPGHVYITYADLSGASALARYSVSATDPNRADPGSGSVLLNIPQTTAVHYAGHLHFGPDGYLYVSRGDGGVNTDPDSNAQNLGTLLGKILRLDVGGGLPYGIPPDNPFLGTPGAQPEIWARGLRNPWRFSFDRVTGDVFIGDVGQSRFEEVNFQPAISPGGENYGWRLMEGGHCFIPSVGCNPGGLTLPILEYDHSLGCSVTGGFRYRGRAIPELYGHYLFSDWCSGRLWTAREDGDGQWTTTELVDTPYSIASFGEDAAGELYIVHRPVQTTGAVYRIVHGSPRPVPAVTGVLPLRVVAPDDGLALLVEGSGFTPASVVRWNDQDRPTTFLSDGLLSADIPAEDVAVPGAASVTVFTPGPGGGASGAWPFEAIEGFADVSGHWAGAQINALVAFGITAGCGGGRFCPDDAVSRAQLAVLLLNGIQGPGASPPAATGAVFGDVPADGFAAAWIERLWALGLTAGCGNGNYCPGAPVTRGEMAVFLLRARHGAGYQPPAIAATPFADVPPTHRFAAWIEQLRAEGLTAGCGGNRYCPESVVTRAQMAVFLVRAFNLPL